MLEWRFSVCAVTIARIVARLGRRGEATWEKARLPGGWSTRLAADNFVCGIEIGGRGQRVVIADAAGRIAGQARSIDSMAPASGVLETVKALVDQACQSSSISRDRIVRVGIAFGGPVDVARGLTLISHRASGFENFPLVNPIEDDLKIPTVLDNSGRAAALGEILYGAARGSEDVVYVHLGTGVGGGIIVDGRLLHGASSTAGEFGHMVVSIGGPICSWASRAILKPMLPHRRLLPGFASGWRLRREPAWGDGPTRI